MESSNKKDILIYFHQKLKKYEFKLPKNGI